MAFLLAVLAGTPCSMASKMYGYGHGYNSTIIGTATGTGIATGTGTPTLAACGIVSSLASVAKVATPSGMWKCMKVLISRVKTRTEWPDYIFRIRILDQSQCLLFKLLYMILA